MNPTPKQFSCLWVIENLPDSVKLRRRLLLGVVETLRHGDPIRAKALEMLSLLDSFDAEQSELPFSTLDHGQTKSGNSH